MSDLSAMSARTGSNASRSDLSLSRPARSRSQAATLAPALRSCETAAAPMPLAAPVTKKALPSSSRFHALRSHISRKGRGYRTGRLHPSVRRPHRTAPERPPTPPHGGRWARLSGWPIVTSRARLRDNAARPKMQIVAAASLRTEPMPPPCHFSRLDRGHRCRSPERDYADCRRRRRPPAHRCSARHCWSRDRS